MKKLFRRRAFHKFPDTKPKWHKTQLREVYKKQVQNCEETRVRVTAVCGYEFNYAVALYGVNGPLEWRDEVKTKKLRCIKCDSVFQ